MRPQSASSHERPCGLWHGFGVDFESEVIDRPHRRSQWRKLADSAKRGAPPENEPEQEAQDDDDDDEPGTVDDDVIGTDIDDDESEMEGDEEL